MLSISRGLATQSRNSGKTHPLWGHAANWPAPVAAGRHRRVRLNDVLDYQRRKRADRRATLDELTEQAAEAGLYDGVPDYTEALIAARKRHAG